MSKPTTPATRWVTCSGLTPGLRTFGCQYYLWRSLAVQLCYT
jgi:hypothetical protein